MHYVYLIESDAVRGQRYVGVTSDLKARIQEHSAGKSTQPAAGRGQAEVAAVEVRRRARPAAINAGEAVSDLHRRFGGQWSAPAVACLHPHHHAHVFVGLDCEALRKTDARALRAYLAPDIGR